MKIGETIPVTIAGQNVAQATVKELADGTVTLEFPATRVVMAIRTELAPEVEAPKDTTGTSVVIEDAHRAQPQIELSQEPVTISNGTITINGVTYAATTGTVGPVGDPGPVDDEHTQSAPVTEETPEQTSTDEQ